MGGCLEGAQGGYERHPPSCAGVLGAKESEVEPGVVSSECGAPEAGIEFVDDICEHGCMRDVVVGDAVDVGRIDRALRVEARGPRIKYPAMGIGGDDRKLKDAVVGGGQACRFDVDDRESWVGMLERRHRVRLGRPCRRGLRSAHDAGRLRAGSVGPS